MKLSDLGMYTIIPNPFGHQFKVTNCKITDFMVDRLLFSYDLDHNHAVVIDQDDEAFYAIYKESENSYYILRIT